MIYPGSHARTWQSWDLNSESLNPEPVTTIQYCLSLEKHAMKIKNHGPNPTSTEVLFLLYRVSKISNFTWNIWISSFSGNLRHWIMCCSVLYGNNRLNLSFTFPLGCSVCPPVPGGPASLDLPASGESHCPMSHLKGRVTNPPLTLGRAPVSSTIGGHTASPPWVLLSFSMKWRWLTMTWAINFHVKVKWDGKWKRLKIELGTK